MTRRIVQVGSQRIVFSPLEPPPLANRWQALVKIRVIDEMTGAPPTNDLTIEVAGKEMIPVISSDGFGGLVGIPIRSFPKLKTQDYFVDIVIGARGFASRTLTVKIDQDLNFLNSFTPADFSIPPNGPVELHREPIVISGRTVRFVGGTSAPVSGATINITEIQRTTDSAAVPPNLVALSPSLYEDRAATTQFVRRRDVTVVGSSKTLLDDVLEGENPIRLSDRLGLAVGDLIQIDAGDPELAEVIAIAAFDPAIPADQPATITVDYPAGRRHGRGALVSRINPLAPGGQQQITVFANSGDTCVFLDGLAGLAGASEIEVIGPPKSEYHQVSSFSVVSDANGYFRLPPLSRVAQLKIHAERLIGAQLFATTVPFGPDYQQYENRLDLVLEPP
jgi:hypothetical protein